ncbi:MAG TPA: hypothetical protein VKB86_21760 [Pyrinomonadaceae bacterium]|nr:hypothetical protein [Pyrinomonadaceae bacterium]
MGHSRGHFPACGITTARSEKEDKRIHNRRFRHRIKRALKTFDPEAEVLPVLREVSNVWDMAKDGKVIFDPKKYPKLMRK